MKSIISIFIFTTVVSCSIRVEENRMQQPERVQENRIQQPKKIEIVNYDPKWKEVFKEESVKIKTALGSNFLEIYHIGSTSVECLAAKPIIDIITVVKDINKIDTEKLQIINYQNGNQRIKAGKYFVKNTPAIHLYIFQKGNKDIEKNLEFKKILQLNKKIREKYEELKKDFSEKYNDGVEYYKAKSDFIKKTLSK